MSKYDPLTQHLATRGTSRIVMSFSDIERVLGFPLPPSSRKHRAWWSNNPSNSVMTKAWIDAGYQSKEVDLEAEKLVFARLNAVQPESTGSMASAPPDATTQVDHPLFGVLKGLITIPDDLDLTEPADPDWGRRTSGDRSRT